MDFRQLKYFLAIAQEKQITRAAKRLHMEQPPLSRQLMQMEEELGAKLFERGGRELALTAAGRLLKARAEALLLQMDETVMEVKEIESGVRGTLSVGAAVSCVSLLSKPIRLMREQYPQVAFKLADGDHSLLTEMLEKRSVELVVTRLPFETSIPSGKLDMLQLPSDPYVALIPSSWGPSSDEIGMTELASYPLLTLKTDQTTRMHEQIMDEFRRHRLEPNFVCECSSVAIIASLVAAGIGATVFPKSVMSSFSSGIARTLRIRDADFRSDVGILWHKDRLLSKRAKNFIECFRRED